MDYERRLATGAAPGELAYASAALAYPREFGGGSPRLILFGGWDGDVLSGAVTVMEGIDGDQAASLRWSRPRTVGDVPGARAMHTAAVITRESDAKQAMYEGGFHIGFPVYLAAPPPVFSLYTGL